MLLGVMLLALPDTVSAQFIFTTNNDGSLNLKQYTGPGGLVVIPGITNGLAVTSIGDSVFSDIFTLTSVAIPNSVTNIGMEAFFYCRGLTNISVAAANPVFSSLNGVLFNKAQDTLLQYPIGLTNKTYTVPNSVTSIGIEAFSECLNLTYIAMPTSVTNIGIRAFSECSLTYVNIPGSVINIGEVAFLNCRSLTNISVTAANPAFSSLNGVLFNKAGTLVQYPIRLTNNTYTVPAGVTSIGEGAFYGCIWLDNVSIPTGVTSIGSNAFESCSSLINVSIPAGVTNISYKAFAGCTSLANFIIPDGVTSLEDGTFAACTHLTSVTLPASVVSFGYAAFESCSSLTIITFPAGVTNIGNYAFAYCPSLAGIYFLGDAPGLDTGVFYNDNNATVYYLSGASGWSSPFGGRPAMAFNPTGSLQVTLSPSVAIDAGAQWQVDGGLAQPSGAVVANLLAGNHTVSFISINGWAIPASQTIAVSVNSTAITSGTYGQLTYLTNNDGAITITGYTGPGRAVVLPGIINGRTVTAIGASAFQNCPLTNVIIPSSIASMGDSSFSNCTALAGIYFQGNAPMLNGRAAYSFYGDTNASVYYLPGTFGWSSSFGGRPAVRLNPDPVGSLQVTLSPAAAISAGATWQVDGGTWQPSGAIVLGLSTGTTHTVSFSPLNGWAMPISQTVAISVNSYTTAKAAYGQLTYTTNNGAITITGSGSGSPGSTVILPGTINGLPVTRLEKGAFFGRPSLISIMIPDSVTNIGPEVLVWCSSLSAIKVDPANAFYSSTNGILFNKDQTTLILYPGGVGGSYTIPQNVTSIGDYAFELCTALTSVTIPNSVTNIGKEAFSECWSLSNLAIGTNVTSLGDDAFENCFSLTSLTLPSSVSSIGSQAFYSCYSLMGIYFQGDAPSPGSAVFDSDNNATVYYLPWTAGWPTPGEPFGGCPTALWLPQAQTSDASFGVQTNQFGFNLTWASDQVVVVEACTDLANPDWTPVGTNTLTGGSSYFSDPDWTNYPGRFYRLRSP